jgi:hypothetical protein
MKYISLILIVSIMAGCSTYKIITDPPGADISINGEYVGKSPVEAKANCATWGGRPLVDARKDGFIPITGQKLEFEPSIGIILADILLWPLLFINANCPKDSYTLKLFPETHLQ